MAHTANNWRYGVPLGIFLHPTTWYRRSSGGREPAHGSISLTEPDTPWDIDNMTEYIEESSPETPMIVAAVRDPAEVIIRDRSNTAKSLLSVAGPSVSLPPVAFTCLLLLLAIWQISRARRRAHRTNRPQGKNDASRFTTSTGTQTYDQVPPPDNQMSQIISLIDTRPSSPYGQTSEIVPLISPQVPSVDDCTTQDKDRMKSTNIASCSCKASYALLSLAEKPKETPVENQRMGENVLFQRAAK